MPDVGAKPATIGHGASFGACHSRISLVVGSGAPRAVTVPRLAASPLLRSARASWVLAPPPAVGWTSRKD
jgi:hypothetical protein